MHLIMAKKANKLLHKYRVQEFPVPLELVEHIIYSEGIDIQITKYLKRAVFCDNIIYIGEVLENGCRSEYREHLVHETAHVYHCGNTAILDPIVVDKNEGQAKAFAAYFLMPIGVFESYLAQEESDYSLAEIFGIKLELIGFRKDLFRSLLESGNYESLIYSF